MKWAKLFSVAAAGFVLGYITYLSTQNHSYIKPERALKLVKNMFNQDYEVSGSWIYMKPTTIDRNGLTYDIYQGGITKHINGEHQPVQFYLDAKTGTILDVFEEQ
ncbi:hypothetical protein J416_14218 [Gracilibacillus halophilus YIM-C55.5]|uniref:PepSY domain-containing protein n=1 Tax=Gracilibacillus halophilus YIM-C55.5 TaxID=1308866 RepID=N4WHZ5_9BACI|nr:hypothetical protein [Gracilibacillus halophilus]ENH95797.1 hypothetical protein J416_14218 [Gracilibacillus halophilus YIM-C55.5]